MATTAVIIGRFQPFHLGHLELYKEALKISGDRVIVVIGSDKAPRSTRNPFDSLERTEFISAFLKTHKLPIPDYVWVKDSAYNFNSWLEKIRNALINAVQNKKADLAIVGCYKDDTSYYLNYFPDWILHTLPPQKREMEIVNSTDIRAAMYENRWGDVIPYVGKTMRDTLKEQCERNIYFPKLVEEYNFIKKYKEQFKSLPYPPTFVTADAAVFCKGHVLLIGRGRHPGKGLYAMPGGFVGQDETITKACLRELKEETHIDVDSVILENSIRDTVIFDHPLRDPRGRFITHVHYIHLNTKGLPSIKADDDASHVEWVPIENIDNMTSEFFIDHGQIIKYFINRLP